MTDEICQLCLTKGESKNLTSYHLKTYHEGMSKTEYDNAVSYITSEPEDVDADEDESEEEPEEEPEEDIDDEEGPRPEIPEPTPAPVSVTINEESLYYSLRRYRDKNSGWSFDPDREEPKPIPRDSNGNIPSNIAIAIRSGYLKRK